MQEREKQFFLQCLSEFLQEKPTTQAPEELQWNGLFEIAQKQSLDAVLYYQCSPVLPMEIKKKYVKQYVSHSAISTRREWAVQELARCTQEKGISLIFMKGAVLRELYPIPALRSMGDLDCIVRKEDRDEVDRILQQEMGYERFIDNHDVWTYWKDTIYFEIHTHMFYEYLANTVDYRSYFDQIWKHACQADVMGVHSNLVYVPEKDFHFLYLIVHTAKHITNNGSGFRAYLDMALFSLRWGDQLNWEFIRQGLEKLELLQFAETCFSLCEYWFGIKMPFRRSDLDDSFLEEATRKTFEDGVFGLNNKANEGAHSAKELKKSSHSRLMTALLLTWKKLFPPYEDMQLIPWYSFVDGKPWLMPYAWVYRWIYCLKNKRKQGTDLLAEPFAKRELITARESWLRQWGL